MTSSIEMILIASGSSKKDDSLISDALVFIKSCSILVLIFDEDSTMRNFSFQDFFK